MRYRALGEVPTGPQPGYENLPKAEFAFPGPLRDKLVAAILDGSKTSTAGLVIDYEHEGEPLPEAGDRSVLVDSDERPVGIIEVTGVRVVPLAEVDLAHALDEGEDYADVAAWRAGHERSGTARRCGRPWATPGSPWTTRHRRCWNASAW